MREIKIRMWNNVDSNPEHSRYFYDPAEVMECLKQQMMFNAGVRGIGAYDHISDGNSFELFTGLKDKNGVEIWEGDILHMGDPRILYVIEWIDTGLKARQHGNQSTAGIQFYQKWIEVIGNIYENPELLNQ